ncbi:MAG: hypothetical protein ACP5TX_06590, partial [Thermoplasmata archaeon]
VILKDYYTEFTQEYLDIAKDVKNQENYIELHFPKNMDVSLIKQKTNIFIKNLSSLPNIFSIRTLVKNELYSYYKSLISGSFTQKELPIVSFGE